MQRVCIIGCGGSGKSTLSDKLGRRSNLPIIHLDTLFYKENWEEIGQKIFDERLNNALKQDKWIIDGNFNKTMDVRFEIADTIVFLDYSRLQSLCGVFIRLIRDHGKVRKDMAQGCPESFDWEFLKYVYSFNKIHRPKIIEKLQNLEKDKNIILFKSRKESEQWLETL